MKNITLLTICALIFAFAQGQDNVGIGTLTPNSSALVDMVSNNKGLMIPRLTATQRNAISGSIGATERGLLVFDQTDVLFYYWDGTQWLGFPQDNSTTNEIDNISISNDTISMSNGSFIVLPQSGVTDTDDQGIDVLNLNGNVFEISLQDDGQTTYTLDLSSIQDGTGTDNQQLNMSNDTIYLEDGGFVIIPPAMIDTDNQTLNLNNDTLFIADGNFVVLNDNVNDADFDATNEIQTLSVSNDTLFLSNGGFVILTDNVNDADSDNTNELQNLSFQNDSLFIQNGNVVDLSSLNAGGGEFIYETGTVHNTTNVNIADYVFGSTSLDNIAGGNDDFRVLFDKSKGAFRAGSSNDGSWDNVNRGSYSFAGGFNTMASGLISTAFGNQTRASGSYATSMGLFSIASGTSATAIGDSSVAAGNYSLASGFHSNAAGVASTALGNQTQATNTSATALGVLTTASGYASTSIGEGSVASGNHSLSTGIQTNALGNVSTAMGSLTTASAPASTAMGINTVASGLYSTALGSSSNASGDISLATGASTIASGDGATSSGLNTIASGFLSTAAGDNTSAPSYGETAVGVFTDNYTPDLANGFDEDDRIFAIGNGTNNSNRNNALTVLKNGNVGVGTPDPSQKLHVENENSGSLETIRVQDLAVTSFGTNDGELGTTTTTTQKAVYVDGYGIMQSRYVYGDNLRYRKGTVNTSKNSATYTDVSEMSITFVPRHNVVFVTYSMSGTSDHSTPTEFSIYTRLLKDGIVQGGAQSIAVAQTVHFHKSWNVSMVSFPVNVTPGVPTTIKVQWMRDISASGTLGISTGNLTTLRNNVASNPNENHRSIFILD